MFPCREAKRNLENNHPHLSIYLSLLHELRDDPNKFESRDIRSGRSVQNKRFIFPSGVEDRENRDEKGRRRHPTTEKIKNRGRARRKKWGRVAGWKWRGMALRLGRCCPHVARLETKRTRVLELWLFPREPVTRLCNEEDRYEATIVDAKTEDAFHEERKRGREKRERKRIRMERISVV